MNQPAFWSEADGTLGRLLNPLGSLYAGVTAWRLEHAQPWTAPVPVICVGNLTAGGTGKTPVVRDLAERLSARGYLPAVLSRGYGGRARGPLKVDQTNHNAAQVGDEPLLMARNFACWIAADRAAGARAAILDGARAIVMDDGLQNPDLEQNLRLIVADGAVAFGNRRALPAGPLRETIGHGIGRAHGLIVVGEDRHGLAQEFGPHLPVLSAKLETSDGAWLAGQPVVGFAGIGRPTKFHETLSGAGADIRAFRPFPDHHPFRSAELRALADDAARAGALLVTTEKDWVRLTPHWQMHVRPVAVSLTWRDASAIDALLDRVAPRG